VMDGRGQSDLLERVRPTCAPRIEKINTTTV
jgi:hypothetical protein